MKIKIPSRSLNRFDSTGPNFIFLLFHLNVTGEQSSTIAVRMECSYHGSPYGTMSLLCGKGVLLPPAELPFQVSFKVKSESQKHKLYSSRGTLCCLQSLKTDGARIFGGMWTNPVGEAACSNFLRIPSKHDDMSPCSLSTREELSRPYYGTKLQRQHKLFPYLVVKAEVTGTGSPDGAFQLTEISLNSKVRGVCFYTVTAFVAIFLFVAMAVGHPFVLLLDPYRRKLHHFIAKMWATLTVTPFFKIKFEGLENLPPPDTPAVYVSNHQSFLDIYTLLTLGRPFKFISKTSIFLFPVIGWAMFLLRVIPLKRMDSRSQLDCLKRCMDLIRKGASVFFFPEGTRSKDGKLGSFKKGAFSVAAKTKVPVVPITLIGTGALMPAGKERILNSGSVKVVIHKPLEGSDPVALCNETRNIIADVLNKQG